MRYMAKTHEKYHTGHTEIMALAILLIGEICFYKADSIRIYFLCTAVCVFAGMYKFIKRILTGRVHLNVFPVWAILVYSMYLINGILRLQRGEFSSGTILYRMLESISIYFVIRDIFKTDKKKIVLPFIIAGLFSLGFLIFTEGTALQSAYIRIGNTMSGNVNTVGYNFGIISMFVTWWYCNEKKWYKIVLFVLFAIAMLLTGSKKVIIILLLDALLLFFFDRNHAGRWLNLTIGIILAAYLIFNVPALFRIMGVRIESMFDTLLYGRSTNVYSYSTDIRDRMIQEGFQLFLQKPLFGGGWNNFYAHTTTGFDYSHNNYIELLCSFGLAGTAIYYSKHLSNISFILKKVLRKNVGGKDYLFALVLLTGTVLMDWAAISFSSMCVWYLPLIVSSVIVEDMKFGFAKISRNK